MAKFTRKPGIQHEPQQAAEDAFVSGAEERTGADILPWEAPYVRQEVQHPYALRIPEVLYLQLKWLNERDKDSMQKIIIAGLEREIRERLAKHGIK